MTSRIVGDLLRRAFRQLAAEIEDDDAVRQAHDRAHDVLDHQDGDAAVADAAHRVDHVLGLGRIEAGQHLVEQKERRPRGERTRELEPFLAGGGECAGQHVEPVGETDDARDFARDLARLVERQVFAAETGADRAIVEHREPGERLDDLMRAREPVARDPIGCSPVMSLPWNTIRPESGDRRR